MEYSEYWLLESAVIAPVALQLICDSNPRGALAAQWNKPSHGLDHSQRQALLQDMHSRNLISFFKNNTPVDDLSPNDLLRALIEPRSPGFLVEYGLSSNGGSLWESVADPDWHRFYSCEPAAEGRFQIEAIRRQTAERALDFASQQHRVYVNTSSLHYYKRRPFRATYWKTLASGWAIEYSYGQERHDSPCSSPSDCDLEEATRSYRRDYEFFHDWYRRPY